MLARRLGIEFPLVLARLGGVYKSSISEACRLVPVAMIVRRAGGVLDGTIVRRVRLQMTKIAES